MAITPSAAGRRAEIVGGGISGLTAATALAQRGWSVRLHERNERIRAFGAGIYVWGNGLRALRALGRYEQAVAGAHVGPVLETRDHRDRPVERLPINDPGRPEVLTVLRERLIGALVDGAVEAGVEIAAGSEVVVADPDGTIRTASGEEARADLVVVADGVNSRLRDRLGLLSSRARVGQGATRLTVPRAEGYVAAGDADKYLEFFAGRRRVLYTPSSADELYVALVADEDDAAGRRVPVDVDAWVRSFPHLERLLRACAGVDGRWDAFEFLTLRAWSRGRVAVTGDAAHAQPPYLGQGGACAMMGALGLADALSREGAGGIEERLAAWEERERPLIEHTQQWSYRLRLLNRVPDAPRSSLLSLAGRCRTFGTSRLRAAMAVPTGAEPVAGSAA
ncbi:MULTISPECIES: FAD-dependent monooxygenase [unclassified Streptomyces]|uniref:FAD-dependent monooxygenase n=1 Tax=unclassified Streptomyces TaxID=2593676 RepID=UPI00278C7781|nr:MULTISPECIES: FAD-dependent monooxygenase [unclassified Streptomyces]